MLRGQIFRLKELVKDHLLWQMEEGYWEGNEGDEQGHHGTPLPPI